MSAQEVKPEEGARPIGTSSRDAVETAIDLCKGDAVSPWERLWHLRPNQISRWTEKAPREIEACEPSLRR